MGKIPAPSSVTSHLRDKMDQWEALLCDVKSGNDQFKVFEDESQDHVDVRYVPALNKVKLYIRSEAKLIFIPIALGQSAGGTFLHSILEGSVHSLVGLGRGTWQRIYKT